VLEEAVSEQFDLIVIGGGVTGAGIALDASLRGIKTLLLEKEDFASGTSSKSTKLIHGGLRYLKQFEIGLVRESGLERSVAHKNIPHLVHPENMLLPIVKGGTFGKLSASLAISVYDFLAAVPREDKKKSLNKNQTIASEPLLKKERLKAGIIYSEYRTDDARLTIELIKAAYRSGAQIFNYMLVEDFVYDSQNKIIGVKAKDISSEQNFSFNATQVVSAAGPWVDELREINLSKKGKRLHLTKGVHIVVPFDKLPIKSSIYFDSNDGRMLFAIPRNKTTYIGTSDTNYTGNKNEVKCTQEDVSYILSNVNNMFSIPPLTLADVSSSWAGLRPLIHEDGKSPSELSRSDEIFISESNLISIAGGKLTGYRKMAKRIVDLLQKRNANFSQIECKTKNYKIHLNSFADYQDYLQFKNALASKFELNIEQTKELEYLCSCYGKSAEQIINQALNTKNDFARSLIKAEINHVLKYESAIHPLDYIIRRSGKLFFDIDAVQKHLSFIIQEFGNYYSWNTGQVQNATLECESAIVDATIS